MSQINTWLPEGRLLVAAISDLSLRHNRTPEEILNALQSDAERIYKETPLPADPKPLTFEQKISKAINQHSAENDSNTPDFILAQYMLNCLKAFNEASNAREKWYGTKLYPGHKEVLKTEL